MVEGNTLSILLVWRRMGLDLLPPNRLSDARPHRTPPRKPPRVMAPPIIAAVSGPRGTPREDSRNEYIHVIRPSRTQQRFTMAIR